MTASRSSTDWRMREYCCSLLAWYVFTWRVAGAAVMQPSGEQVARGSYAAASENPRPSNQRRHLPLQRVDRRLHTAGSCISPRRAPIAEPPVHQRDVRLVLLAQDGRRLSAP